MPSDMDFWEGTGSWTPRVLLHAAPDPRGADLPVQGSPVPHPIWLLKSCCSKLKPSGGSLWSLMQFLACSRRTLATWWAMLSLQSHVMYACVLQSAPR